MANLHFGYSALRAACFAVLALVQLPLSAQADQSHYHIVAKQVLDSGSRWDYLTYDGQWHRLFISHGDHVDVYDIRQKSVTGKIPDTLGVHGVALVPALDLGFTSNGKADTVTVFRISDLHIQASIPGEQNPDAIVYDPASQHIFVANGNSNSLTIIDAKHLQKIGIIALAAKPEFAVADGQGSLFVNGENTNQLLVIDTLKQTLTHRYNLAPACNEPTGLALDQSRRRLFVGCHNSRLVVVNADNGVIVQSLPIDAHNDAVIYDSKTGLVFSSNGAGTLTVLERKSDDMYAVKQTVTTMPTVRTMALDPESGRIFMTGIEALASKPNSKQSTESSSFSFELLTLAP